MMRRELYLGIAATVLLHAAVLLIPLPEPRQTPISRTSAQLQFVDLQALKAPEDYIGTGEDIEDQNQDTPAEPEPESEPEIIPKPESAPPEPEESFGIDESVDTDARFTEAPDPGLKTSPDFLEPEVLPQALDPAARQNEEFSGSRAGQASRMAAAAEIPVYSILDVDEIPAIISAPALEYPRDARRRNLEGAVVLEVDIGTDGRAGNIRVVTASAGIFEESAVRHIENARFSPGRVGGRAIPVRMRITVRFNLR